MGRWELLRPDPRHRPGVGHRRLRLLGPRPLRHLPGVRRGRAASAQLRGPVDHGRRRPDSAHGARRRDRLRPRQQRRLRPHRHLRPQCPGDRRPLHRPGRPHRPPERLRRTSLGRPELRIMCRMLPLAALALVAAGCAGLPGGTAGPLPSRATARPPTTGDTPPPSVVGNTPPAEAGSRLGRPGWTGRTRPTWRPGAERPWTLDTTEDAGPFAPQARASAYCTPAYAGEAAPVPAGVAAGRDVDTVGIAPGGDHGRCRHLPRVRRAREHADRRVRRRRGHGHTAGSARPERPGSRHGWSS